MRCYIECKTGCIFPTAFGIGADIATLDRILTSGSVTCFQHCKQIVVDAFIYDITTVQSMLFKGISIRNRVCIVDKHQVIWIVLVDIRCLLA